VTVPASGDGANSFDGLSGFLVASESEIGAESNDDSFYRALQSERPFHLFNPDQHIFLQQANEEDASRLRPYRKRTITPRVCGMP
jgi:hypothetical protein